MRIFVLMAALTLAGLLGTASSGFAQSVVTPTAIAGPVQWTPKAVPWDAWFKKNTMVTDKTGYVHFFWNAQDFKVNFEVKDKKTRLAEAALQLVARLYPSGAKADLVKVDIVYVLERDNYGEPKWDSLQQVAHMEFSKARTKGPSSKKGFLAGPAVLKKFGKIDIY